MPGLKRVLHLTSGKRVGHVTPLVAAGATHEYEMQLAEYVRQLYLPLSSLLSLFYSLSLSLSPFRPPLVFRY